MTRRRWTLATIFLPCGLTLAVVWAATPGSDVRRTLADRPSPEIPHLTWPIGAGPVPQKRRMSAEQAGRVHLALAWDALHMADWNACLTHAAIASDIREGDPEPERLMSVAEARLEAVKRLRQLLVLPAKARRKRDTPGRVIVVWCDRLDAWINVQIRLRDRNGASVSR